MLGDIGDNRSYRNYRRKSGIGTKNGTIMQFTLRVLGVYPKSSNFASVFGTDMTSA